VADQTVHIRGLAGLQRAFKLANKEEAKLLRATLVETAQPVKRAAEGKAVSKIRNIGGPWSQMRVGAARSVVYLAPKQKGRASRGNASLRRPNLKDLLLDRAMIPALDEHREEVVVGVEHMLDTVGSRWERA
jgi:hypothetical protein